VRAWLHRFLTRPPVFARLAQHLIGGRVGSRVGLGVRVGGRPEGGLAREPVDRGERRPTLDAEWFPGWPCRLCRGRPRRDGAAVPGVLACQAGEYDGVADLRRQATDSRPYPRPAPDHRRESARLGLCLPGKPGRAHPPSADNTVQRAIANPNPASPRALPLMDAQEFGTKGTITRDAAPRPGRAITAPLVRTQHQHLPRADQENSEGAF